MDARNVEEILDIRIKGGRGKYREKGILLAHISKPLFGNQERICASTTRDCAADSTGGAAP